MLRFKLDALNRAADFYLLRRKPDCPLFTIWGHSSSCNLRPFLFLRNDSPPAFFWSPALRPCPLPLPLPGPRHLLPQWKMLTSTTKSHQGVTVSPPA